MANIFSIKSPLEKYQRFALLIGLAALAISIFGITAAGAAQFLQSYLITYIFWLGLSLGSLGFLLIHYLTGCRWGLTIRRINEAAATTILLMLFLFLPILFNLRSLYIWAQPEAVSASTDLIAKSRYLNVTSFIIRTGVYFLVWIILAVMTNYYSSKWTSESDPKYKATLQRLGAIGLIVYTLTMTFATIDWIMSLQPAFDSTAYGLITIFAQLLSALAFAILILNLLPETGLGLKWSSHTTPIPVKDLGAMLFTFILTWAYLTYFQFLIVWAGNLPHEVNWILERVTGGWMNIGWIVIILLFLLPFILLLSIKIRHNLRLLAVMGGLILVVSFVNIFWQIAPAFHPAVFSLHWMDVLLPIGMGGIWIGVFLFALQQRPTFNESDRAEIEPAS